MLYTPVAITSFQLFIHRVENDSRMMMAHVMSESILYSNQSTIESVSVFEPEKKPKLIDEDSYTK